jgi:hypothetical protein
VAASDCPGCMVCDLHVDLAAPAYNTRSQQDIYMHLRDGAADAQTDVMPYVETVYFDNCNILVRAK